MAGSDTSPFASSPTSWDVEYRMALSQLLDLRKCLRRGVSARAVRRASALDEASLQCLIEQTEQLEILFALLADPDAVAVSGH